MIPKSNQYVNDRELTVKKGVRFSPEDAQRYSGLSLELGLNDRRGADGFAEFARLAIRFAADHVEKVRAGHRKDWKERVLREFGMDPDEVFPE